MTYTQVSCPVLRERFQHSGLELLLDVEAGEYLSTSTQMGFLVMIHGKGFLPDVCNHGVFVEPGYISYIGLQYVSGHFSILHD